MMNAMDAGYSGRAVVKIISTACRHCRDCVEICPEEALSWVQGQVVVDEDHCTGCARCVQICRIKILKIYPK